MNRDTEFGAGGTVCVFPGRLAPADVIEVTFALVYFASRLYAASVAFKRARAASTLFRDSRYGSMLYDDYLDR